MRRRNLKSKIVTATMAGLICATLSVIPASAATTCTGWEITSSSSVHCGNPYSCGGPGGLIKSYGQNVYWKRKCMDKNTGKITYPTRTTWKKTGGCC